MGNCIAAKRKCLRVVKTDGKILEYRRPMLVKEIMMNFCGYGVSLSNEAARHLPTNYELKIGHVYYLLRLPRLIRPVGSSSSPVDSDSVSGMKRIKVIVTKQQLEELLSKKISVEEMLSRLRDRVDSLTRWRPLLETIPEGNE